VPQHRIALIGLGMAVTPHAKSLFDLQHRAEVAHAFTRSAERRASFAARFPFPLADDVDRVLADPAVTAVAILTPPSTHLELVRKAAAAGKHVLLEKPLEITTARAESLVAAAEQAGVTLGVVLQHRFRPAAERLSTILKSGELGRIVNCSTTIRLWRPQSYYDEPGRGTKARDGGGVLLTQGIHTLDVMLSLAGPVAEVTGYAMTSPVHRMETEDMVAAAVRFANGALGVIDATTAAYPGFPERIEIAAERGSAALVGSALLVQFQDGRREELQPDGSPGGTGADPMAFPHDWHRGVWADFLDAVERRRAPRISGEEALNVHRLIDAVLEAGQTGRPVPVRVSR
jgi:UDP-N-acetyl-2-amino-2-deoxyglucuronate dehydrogenase